ncbi:MAG TPA: AAA family ATPase [Burkholderiaceae bacterium]|nr:AAA family ATPase [Burkholderiaceae bacterium]HQR72356.1 AAA family ATPase [Burkholderiaceae bacterium]
MTSDHLRIAESLPPQVRIALTVLAIKAKTRLAEQRRPRAEREPPLIAVLLSPHLAARGAAMAVMARHLGAPVQRVDWTRLMSPYPDAAELNVERLFDAAEHAGVLLLFDEADALFGPHGRPIDLADSAHEACTDALLSRMARFDGPVCFTASHRRHLHPRLLASAEPVIDLTDYSR